nr:MAG TPA: hypothetical protein [Caudoviricetes sp.]
MQHPNSNPYKKIHLYYKGYKVEKQGSELQ